uniref:Uncharacterized protein n=1 Tax=Ananas comosus var. bracteatus TaxID=296719 RepID=A0A6V7NTL4_ANACO|nr:unnamed protein product [Ananas comosus var. bracteatus]
MRRALIPLDITHLLHNCIWALNYYSITLPRLAPFCAWGSVSPLWDRSQRALPQLSSALARCNRSLPMGPVSRGPVSPAETGSQELIFRDLANFFSSLASHAFGDRSLQQELVPESPKTAVCRFLILSSRNLPQCTFTHFNAFGISKAY